MVGYERISYYVILLGGNMGWLRMNIYVIMLGDLYVGIILLCDVLSS